MNATGIKAAAVVFAAGMSIAACADGNSVVLRADAKNIKYDPMIFGSFLEHFDNQVYGGVFDPKSPLSDADGFRKDVIDALKKIRLPIVRWPGGCFVSAYHWQDGVGPNREPTYDKAWFVEEPNTFGTDEYVKWCRKVGCEPYICTNAGTGTPEEMSDWVEYCNQTVGKFARMRVKNGHKEPYNIRYWSVGNENWGRHETGARTVGEWGPFVRESAKMMRAADIRTKLLAAATPNERWTLPLLREAGYLLDYVCIHHYGQILAHKYSPKDYLGAMMLTDNAENNIRAVRGILEKANLGDGRVKIAYDEWNLRGWHHPWHGDFRRGMDVGARRKNDTHSTYTMADAVYAACQLNSFLRNGDIVGMACFAPVVNTTGFIFVHGNGIVKRTTYHVYDMYVNGLLPEVAPCTVECARLGGWRTDTGIVDAVVTTDAGRSAYRIAIANKSPDTAQKVRIDFASLGKSAPAKVKARMLVGDSKDAFNSPENPDRVVPAEAELAVADGCVEIPAHAVAVLSVD